MLKMLRCRLCPGKLREKGCDWVIVQVGMYPPPMGGVSVYIERMKKNLDLRGIENMVWNIGGLGGEESGVTGMRLRYAPFHHMVSRDIEVVHYNICEKSQLLYTGIMNAALPGNKRTALTLHGDASGMLGKGGVIMARALGGFDSVICVKAGDRKLLEKMGVKSRIYEIPAYMDPVESFEDESKIEPGVSRFIEKTGFLMAANGAIRFCERTDLYGFDMIIDLCTRLKREGVSFGMLLAILSAEKNGERESAYYGELKSRIVELGLEEDILMYEPGDAPFYPVLKRSHLFLRPTATDGYALSVAEAINFSVPVVASDSGQRPEGVVEFESRNFDDFYEKVSAVIKNYGGYKKRIEAARVQDNFERIMDVYESLSKRSFKVD